MPIVAMFCQQCRTPLRLDDSLQHLNPAAFSLVLGDGELSQESNHSVSNTAVAAGRSEPNDKVPSQSTPPLFKKSIPASRRGITAKPPAFRNEEAKDGSTMSFVLLSESQVDSPPPMESPTAVLSQASPSQAGKEPGYVSHSLPLDTEHSVRLFELLSAYSDIDHPICSDCTELLLAALQTRLSASLKERDAYIGFMKDLKSHKPSDKELAKSSQELSDARAAENAAYTELLGLEGEKARLEEELASLDAESRRLDAEENEFWKSRNSLDQKLSWIKESRDALNASMNHDLKQLGRLERTNVYNDTFFISHDGPFGTINGLRLGRLPPPNNVEWPEINAAWGTTAFLISTVAGRLGYVFQGYALRPMGSTTHIEKFENDASLVPATISAPQPKSRVKCTNLELFSSGDLPLGRQILHRRFNEAMVAFLECLRQLCEHVRSTPGRSTQAEAVTLPPYKIEKDKINGVSIKLGVSQDEDWTTACKYTLTCCKFLLAHTACS